MKDSKVGTNHAYVFTICNKVNFLSEYHSLVGAARRN